MIALFALLSSLPLALFSRPPVAPQETRVPTAHDAGGWMREARLEIERSEYRWSAAQEGTYTAPNRVQGIESRVGAGGIELSPASGERPAGANAPWRLSLRSVSFGRECRPGPLEAPEVMSREDRVELRYGDLTEWYVNDERGLEHGWTITRPPAGLGSGLWIEMRSRGLVPEVADDGLSAVFADEAGVSRLRYGGLRAWDATGRDLAARLLRTPAGLAVRVDDRGARYPVTIDPIFGLFDWRVSSGQATALLSRGASAGDVNGDGFDDVLLGAREFNAGQNDEGRAFLYLGSASGPSLQPDWTAESDQDNAKFGRVAGAGDVNGDGFDDVLVGAPYFDHGQTDEGRAFVFLGSANGPSLVADWTAEVNKEVALFGFSVAGAGDVNGDGFDDIVVGAIHNRPPYKGAAYVYLGSASGPSLAPDWMVEGNSIDVHVGYSVAGAGDVNGDGYDDIVLGTSYAYDGVSSGVAHLYFGSPSGPSAFPDWTARGSSTTANLGHSVAGAGDVNGDGFDDVLCGAPRMFADEGRALLYLGSPSGLSADPDWTSQIQPDISSSGRHVAGANDVNGDGFADVLVDVIFDDGQASVIHTWLYLGSAAGLAPVPNWETEGGTSCGAGDVNGDGLADVLLAGERALLYLGDDIQDCNANGIDDQGDIASGTSVDANGNSVPDECECRVENYCEGGLNSAGVTALMESEGPASLTANSFVLRVRQAPPNRTGFFFFGGARLMVPFRDGFRCVGAGPYGGIFRLFPVLQTSGLGIAERALDFGGTTNEHRITPFTETTFQFWYRDLAGPLGTGSNLSDGLAVTFCP